MGLLEVKGINKRFGGLQALGDVNLSIEENTTHAIIGSNGAGKSILLNVLVGKLIPDSGSAMFVGQPVWGRKPHELNQMGTSRVFQTPEIFSDLTVFENVMIPCFAKRDGAFRMHAVESIFAERVIQTQADAILDDVNMLEKKDMVASSLSRGDKRRLEMAMCLVQDPRLLLLDEPTAGVDVELRRDMWNIVADLKADGVTIILTTHYIEEAEAIADRVAVINHGEILLVEEKDTLMRRMGQKHLCIDLTQPLTTLPDGLSEFDLEIALDGYQLVYTYAATGERTGITRLLSALAQAGISLKDLQTSQSSLEDIFVGLVKDPSSGDAVEDNGKSAS